MKKLLLAVALCCAVTSADAQRVPNYTDPAGRSQQGLGVACLDPATGVAVSCGSDSNDAAFQGAVPLTVGTPTTPLRSIGIVCTSAGNVSLTFADASVFVIPVAIGFQSYPFAISAVNTSGTTATCTYANFK